MKVILHNDYFEYVNEFGVKKTYRYDQIEIIDRGRIKYVGVRVSYDNVKPIFSNKMYANYFLFEHAYEKFFHYTR